MNNINYTNPEIFDLLIGSPHDEVVKILKRHGIVKSPGRGERFDDIRQYIFTQQYTGTEYLVNFQIGGTRALDSVVVNLE